MSENTTEFCDLEKVVHTFVSTRLITETFCMLVSLRSVFFLFFSSSLQLAQNAAARFLTRSRNRHRISEIPASSLWLPVSWRLRFKTLFFVYTALNGLSPASMCDPLLLHTVRHLRSSNQRPLSVHRLETKCCVSQQRPPNCEFLFLHEFVLLTPLMFST